MPQLDETPSEFAGPPTLIASDVDGTLIDNQNTVPELVRTMITKATAAGATFVIATGRPPRWIAEITDQLEVEPLAVCANGAIVYDVATDQVLHSATLKASVLEQLAALAYEQIPGCGLAVERVGKSAHDAATPPFVATAGYQHAWLNPDHIEMSEADVLSENAVKMLVRRPELSSDEMARRLEAVVGDLADVTFSTDNGLIELSAPGVSKASGLRTLAELKDLPTGASIAFGDMPNDVEMLRWVTRGFAMAGGHPAAIAAADEIAPDNNSGGVGQVLARWF
ncbi:HAD family hydrolase [Williamsia muralis]|uniref:HAD family hydrolase n=1 Tax=Williamsia marianensis TaxID=85044 RepID=A0A2G3PMK2_WILMA|nr:HAD family hydrolase [Williamsia marianensis]PHV66986.1 HAD family hydrolase [Williamsia marianensis]PZU04265.1 MAG: HAD family hydrolase [Gordonia sp. (in: high G+C Gram-positive bacteria)]